MKCPHCEEEVSPKKTPVRRKMDRLKLKLEKAQDEIDTLQRACKHPHVVKTHDSNTGNWDPNADCYWTNFCCPDCDKRWMKDGSL